jgi:uncharacterized protein
MRTRLAWVIGLLLCVGEVCFADEASHRKVVEELFNRINMAATVDQTAMQVAAAVTGTNSEDQEYADTVREYVRKYVSWEPMKDEIIGLYMKTFTEQEIKDLIAFYNTPAGIKLLDQSGAIGQAVSVSVHQRLVAHSPELKKMMMDADFKAFRDALGQDGAPPDKK